MTDLKHYDKTAYPYTPDNPCRDMTDEQFASYIRERREAFAPVWEKYEADRRARILEDEQRKRA
jgi:hypothetical protein